MKPKFIDYYMKIATVTAGLSYARRLQVGAVVVKDNQILATGYNGMPSGWDNNCEDKDYMSSDAGGWLSPEEIYERWPFEEIVIVANDNAISRLKPLILKKQARHYQRIFLFQKSNLRLMF